MVMFEEPDHTDDGTSSIDSRNNNNNQSSATTTTSVYYQPTSIQAAILHKDLNALHHLLLQEGDAFDANAVLLNTGEPPLLSAIGPSPIDLQICHYLLEHTNSSATQRGQLQSFVGWSPLKKACHVGHIELVQLILSKLTASNAELLKQELEYCVGDRRTVLIQMAKSGDLAILQLLIEHGANIHHYDQQAMNVLMHACTENHYEMCRYLVEQTCLKVNDYKVDTAIWYAAAHGNAQIVELLIVNGAHIEYRQDGTIYSSTPLMEACEWGHDAAVQVLLEYGADPSNSTGKKALKLAKTAGYHKVVHLMQHWSRRLRGLEAVLDNDTESASERRSQDDDSSRDYSHNGLPTSFLPYILVKTAKRYDLMFRILRQHGDTICDHARKKRP